MKRICLLVSFLAIAATPLAAQSKSSPRPSPTPTPKSVERQPVDATQRAVVLNSQPGAISRLRITVTTGADDLRDTSKVSAFLVMRDGRIIKSPAPALNCSLERRFSRGRGTRVVSRCEGIPAHTRRTFEWNLDQVILPADVHRFGMSFQSGSSGPFETGDNWDLDQLEVEYVVATADAKRGVSAGTFSMYKSEAPVYRFKTREDWETQPLRLPRSTRF